MIDNLSRYQRDLKLHHFYPPTVDVCSCGCGKQLKGKQKRWASDECRQTAYIQFSIIRGNTGLIRKQLFIRDEGFCKNCGVFDSKWQADHIIPVKDGGGACSLDGYQTLCLDCHLTKTIRERK